MKKPHSILVMLILGQSVWSESARSDGGCFDPVVHENVGALSKMGTALDDSDLFWKGFRLIQKCSDAPPLPTRKTTTPIPVKENEVELSNGYRGKISVIGYKNFAPQVDYSNEFTLFASQIRYLRDPSYVLFQTDGNEISESFEILGNLRINSKRFFHLNLNLPVTYSETQVEYLDTLDAQKSISCGATQGVLNKRMTRVHTLTDAGVVQDTYFELDQVEIKNHATGFTNLRLHTPLLVKFREVSLKTSPQITTRQVSVEDDKGAQIGIRYDFRKIKILPRHRNRDYNKNASLSQKNAINFDSQNCNLGKIEFSIEGHENLEISVDTQTGKISTQKN